MNKLTSFNDDFMQKLRDPEFASNYIMAVGGGNKRGHFGR